MKFTPASLQTLIAFGTVLVAVVWMFLGGIYYSSRRLLENPKKATLKVGIIFFIWLGLLSAIVQSGFMVQFLALGIPLILVIIIFCSLWFSLSHWGAKMALAIPITILVAFQVFRLPIALIIDLWAEQGTVPSTMTWTGENFDVVTGLLAMVFAPLAGRYRFIAWGFNIVGIVLYVLTIGVAIMSSPLPFAWKVEPTLQLMQYMPYALIGPVCVGGALAGHVILTRALLYH